MLVAGVPARVGSRAFDVLLALVQRGGRVATKAELLDAAWPGLVVEENNLSVQMASLRKLLGPQAIATVPGIGYRLAAVPLPAAPKGVEGPSGRPVLPVAARLPAPVGLVGREADTRAMHQLLERRPPLVSLVGPGGVGKTALARHLAHDVAGGLTEAWPDGVHWLDLAPLRPGTGLAPVLARALGMALVDGTAPRVDELLQTLAQLRAVIVLDNCEHLLDDVMALLLPALRQVHGITWLATSQEPLHLPGEQVYRLDPLRVPEPGCPQEHLLAHGALALFVERAQAGDRHFAVAPDELHAAVAICREVDGLPLAIEMAAARVATLGLQGVYEQLDQRLRLRAGGRGAPARHLTLQQTYDWSYGLLSPLEQAVFRKLYPFKDGFTPQLVQQLCQGLRPDEEAAGPATGHAPVDDWQLLDVLHALVDKSLLQRRSGGGGGTARLHLLESARDYARLQLLAAGELQAVQRRHAQVMVQALAPAAADLERLRDDDWAARHLPEKHNVRAALAWACEAREPSLLAPLVAALSMMDIFAQAPCEVVRCEVPEDVLLAAPPPLRAAACLEYGWAHYLDGSRERATALVRQAVQDFDALGETIGLYRALGCLTRLYVAQPDQQDQARQTWARMQAMDAAALPLRARLTAMVTVGIRIQGRAMEHLSELLQMADRAGFETLAAVCRTNVSDELLIRGQFDEAARVSAGFLQASTNGPRARGLLWHNLALALVQLRRPADARGAAREMLRTMPGLAHLVVDLFALVAAREGRWLDAAVLAGHADELRRRRNWHADPAEQAIIDETHQVLVRDVDAARLRELLLAGAAMGTREAVALALGE